MGNHVTPTPTPLTYTISQIMGGNGKALMVVTLFTVVGPVTTFWDPGGADTFADQLHNAAMQARTGLVLPPSMNGSAPNWPATPGDDVLDITYDFDPDVGEVFCIGGPFDGQKVPQPCTEEIVAITGPHPDDQGGRITAPYALREPIDGKKALVYVEPGPEIVDQATTPLSVVRDEPETP